MNSATKMTDVYVTPGWTREDEEYRLHATGYNQEAEPELDRRLAGRTRIEATAVCGAVRAYQLILRVYTCPLRPMNGCRYHAQPSKGGLREMSRTRYSVMETPDSLILEHYLYSSKGEIRSKNPFFFGSNAFNSANVRLACLTTFADLHNLDSSLLTVPKPIKASTCVHVQSVIHPGSRCIRAPSSSGPPRCFRDAQDSQGSSQGCNCSIGRSSAMSTTTVED